MSLKRNRKGGVTKHASIRAVERYGGSLDLGSLEDLVQKLDFTYMKRLTTTRSLCVASTDGISVYFIYSRTEQKIITILSYEQAEEHMSRGKKPKSKLKSKSESKKHE